MIPLHRSAIVALLVLHCSRATAAGICPALTDLLTDPPAGFIAARAEPLAPQYWAARPPVPNAKCKLWTSLLAEANNIRCTVNDEADPAMVSAFFEETRREIDQCLTALPDGSKYDRRATPVSTEGLKGTEATWIYESSKLRLKVDLADYHRVVLGSSYNSFSVEYMKY